MSVMSDEGERDKEGRKTEREEGKRKGEAYREGGRTAGVSGVKSSVSVSNTLVQGYKTRQQNRTQSERTEHVSAGGNGGGERERWTDR